jgi:probable rRNA maturation factor
MPIQFRSEKTAFTLKNRSRIQKWILSVIRKEKRIPDEIHYVFCSDRFLLSLNKKYLHHDTLTDIITFDYSHGKAISGEIYISIPRVKENAKKFNVEFEDELCRVMVHGVLHLCEYSDRSAKEKMRMRMAEDRALLQLEPR